MRFVDGHTGAVMVGGISHLLYYPLRGMAAGRNDTPSIGNLSARVQNDGLGPNGNGPRMRPKGCVGGPVLVLLRS